MKVHRISRLVAVSLATAALAAPAASARPVLDPPVAPGSQPVVIEPEPARIVQSVDEGFDWGSAAIGAGVAGSLILLVSAGGISYRHRHEDIGVAQ